MPGRVTTDKRESTEQYHPVLI